jgi:glycosyltransferase involved in cell wall biosynthesis
VHHVLHVIPYMDPRAGGPPVVVRRLARLAETRGWDARVLTTALYCDDVQGLEERLSVDVPAIILSSRSRLGAILSPRTLLATVSELKRGIEVVHFHGLWSPWMTWAAACCRRLALPYVVMPHGMLDPQSVRRRGFMKRSYIAVAERRMLSAASRIIFTTSEEERLARELVPWLPLGAIVPLAPDLPSSNISQGRALFLDTFPQLRETRNVLFLGRIHEKKGPDRLIMALPQVVQSIPAAMLIMAGTGTDSYLARLKSQAVKLGVADKIVWTGSLEGSVKLGGFAASEIFVLPSRQENFAITVAEAMAVGLPVIVSDRVNTCKMILDADVGIVIADLDIEKQLARSIAGLLGDTRRAKAMGERGQAYAARELTWGRSADAMYRTYDFVLADAFDKGNGHFK